VKVLVKVFENWGKIFEEFFRFIGGRRGGCESWLKNLGTIFHREFLCHIGGSWQNLTGSSDKVSAGAVSSAWVGRIDMEYQIQLQTVVDARPLAVVRRQAGVSELSRVVPDACGIVWGALRAQQVKGAGRHVAIYLDDQINLEVGVEMDTPFAGYGEVVGSSLPVGSVAKTVHFGPYGQLGEAHKAIRDWCARHGHALAGPNWEIYGHWEEEWNRDASKIRTDVFYLLKKGAKTAG
jgi:effector-binding domain-containing protein